MVDVVELFHGPGGWAEGRKLLGDMRAVGLELDEWAVNTARRAGHHVLHANVANAKPGAYRPRRGGVGMIASPPCPGFSAAGKGEGRKDLPRIIELAHMLTDEIPADGWHDERSPLTLEVVRWAVALEPRWIALEQVPAVLPVWEAIGERLRAMGYNVWTGLVYAERYGVPQTRTRAILIASVDRVVGEPAATHQRYYPPNHPLRDQPSLEEAALPRWVSMAQALGWGMTERPYPTVACSSSTGGPDLEKVGGSGARAQIYSEQEAGRWMVDTGNTRGGSRDFGRERGQDEPAPTITTRADQLEHGPVAYDRRQSRGGRTGEPNALRSTADPAPTIAGESRNDSWVFDRPATTVAGDPRIWPPGHRVNADDIAAGRGGRQRSGGGFTGRSPSNRKRPESTAVRVSLEEAAVLQSFRVDYPWQGTKTKRFQQVGNAVPPLLAAAVLREAIGL